MQIKDLRQPGENKSEKVMDPGPWLCYNTGHESVYDIPKEHKARF